MLSDVDSGGDRKTNAPTAITGSAKRSCPDQAVGGSQLRTNNGFVYAYDNGAYDSQDEDGEYADAPDSAKSSVSVSGAALIIDWRRRRCRDETVEESVRVGALNLVASTAPGTLVCHQSSRTFVENGPVQTYKYVGSPVTSPTTVPTSPFQSRHLSAFDEMTERELISSLCGNISPGKKNRTNRHVTFSEPEISHVLITHEEPVLTDVLHSPVASVDKPLTIRRCYLAEPGIVDALRRLKSCCCLDTSEQWSEVYYDTPASSLCSLECILMKDTRASKYWKFFSFAEDNIMEITTDEKEINEPLGRLVPAGQNGPKDVTNTSHRGKNADQQRRIIDSDSLTPFFAVRNETNSFLTSEDGTLLKATVTDYGFAWVVVERMCIDGERLADITLELATLATALGLSSLADYDPMRYL